MLVVCCYKQATQKCSKAKQSFTQFTNLQFEHGFLEQAHLCSMRHQSASTTPHEPKEPPSWKPLLDREFNAGYQLGAHLWINSLPHGPLHVGLSLRSLSFWFPHNIVVEFQEQQSQENAISNSLEVILYVSLLPKSQTYLDQINRKGVDIPPPPSPPVSPPIPPSQKGCVGIIL